MKRAIIQFIIMTLVGIFFNPMNMLAYSIQDLYFSTTLLYGGFLMASNMIWSHEIVHYLTMGHFNKNTFLFGILLSISIVFVLLRQQLFVGEENWLKRMIPHHSTALTTTTRLIEKEKFKKNAKLYRLAKDIIYNQKREIAFMKLML
tara:strand:+ start:340 stop:780 length:441 start_codon:yes stop_codon:yes gene_type:complete